MRVNLDGVVDTVKATVPAMRERAAGGHVVVTSSVAGVTALPYEHGAYTTSKFAVHGLGESLRLSLAEEGIGVSILCPGLTDTGMLAADESQSVEFEPIAGAMDPIEVGYAVVRGIHENGLHLLPRRVRRRVPVVVRRDRGRGAHRPGDTTRPWPVRARASRPVRPAAPSPGTRLIDALPHPSAVDRVVRTRRGA